MLDQSFTAFFRSYTLELPGTATLTAKVIRDEPSAGATAHTHWTVSLGRFQLFIRLTTDADPSDLKPFIDFQTKGDVTTPAVSFNGVSGVTHGQYDPDRTWIDWWLMKGDTMICLNLQSIDFPGAAPTAGEQAEHEAIISSLRYAPDHADRLLSR